MGSVLDNVWGRFDCCKCGRFAVEPAPSADTAIRCECGEVVLVGDQASKYMVRRYGFQGWFKDRRRKCRDTEDSGSIRETSPTTTRRGVKLTGGRLSFTTATRKGHGSRRGSKWRRT